MYRERRAIIRLAVITGMLASGLAGQIGFSVHSIISPDACAAGGQEEKYPYGGSRNGVYGEKKAVSTIDEARKVLREYFSKKNVKIGEIREKDLYFEAEIRDRNDNLIDKVILDKRTGRIRSIY